MGPKGYPACVLLSFVVAASFIGMGRVALRARQFARSSPPSIEVRRLPGLTTGLKPRPPGSTTPNLQANRPTHSLQVPRSAVATTYPVAMTISVAGTNPGDFAETDNCSQSPLAGRKTCVMNVTLDPTQTGARSAVLMLSDHAPQRPQILVVSGTRCKQPRRFRPQARSASEARWPAQPPHPSP